MAKLTELEMAFLSRFVARGWLHGTRQDEAEQSAIDKALRKRWLRKELSEVHFTPAGRAALSAPSAGAQDSDSQGEA